jgi:Domain of unknown function (DUF4271)
MSDQGKKLLLQPVKKYVALVIFLACSALVSASDSTRIDLRDKWLMLEDGRFMKHTGAGRVVYILLNDSTQGVIEIKAAGNVDIYLNNKIAASHVKQFRSKMLPASGYLAIFSPAGLDQIETNLITVSHENVWQSKPRSASSSVTLFALILVAVFIILVRSNTPAAQEYFNVVKLFSWRGTEDSAQTMRITSASNIFYYVFCSALIAINLFVFRTGKAIFSLPSINVLLSIFELIILVFGILTIKILLVGLLAGIFNLVDFGPAQFYNYVRLLLLSFILSSVILVVLVMFNANWETWLQPLSYGMAIMSIGFVGVIYLKLMARGGFTVFHLFFYLCASEIVPLIILLNVYFS